MATVRGVLSAFNARPILRELPTVMGSSQSPMRALLPTISRTTYPSSIRYLGATISFAVPSLLSDIWESILRAVPKKKTSHSKKRHRQMAGKALKDTINVNTCSGCGKPKKSHLLCPNCVNAVRKDWQEREGGKDMHENKSA